MLVTADAHDSVGKMMPSPANAAIFSLPPGDKLFQPVAVEAADSHQRHAFSATRNESFPEFRC